MTSHPENEPQDSAPDGGSSAPPPQVGAPHVLGTVGEAGVLDAPGVQGAAGAEGAADAAGTAGTAGTVDAAGAPRRRRRLGMPARIVLATGALAVLAIVVPIATVQIIGAGRAYAIDDVPQRSVALVLGAGLQPGGAPSLYLTRRLDAARELYERGKVHAILVSGDNGHADYDEPTAMFDWLVGAGVPEDRVVRDYAGFDTHDSCMRARDVFGVEDLIVVTQDYHLPRALFSCSAAGLDAVGVGVSSESIEFSKGVQYRVREGLASVKAAWDGLTGRAPVYGGEETSIQDILNGDR